ncbi:MAG: hypothetical protein HYX68_21555 [Planctomycetes bacterium]|nr:hypothetical protein [Planctomycetota bacterium]
MLLVSLRPCLITTICALASGDALHPDITLVAKQGRGTPEGRAAWMRLSNARTDTLPAILEGMSTGDTVAANWLRLAFDKIAERETKAGKAIATGKILAFVKNPAKEGRARRFALEFLEHQKPGTSARLYPDWLDDPEFRYEAVALLLDRASKAKTVELYRQAFDKSRDMLQARAAAAGLEKHGVKVSVGEHLGFLMNWHLIGPFDGHGQKGLRSTYPPEKSVDLTAELVGQKGKVRWKRYQVKEPANNSSSRHQALVDLREKRALGSADDAIAFAYSYFHVARAMDAEMRGAADDNFAVFVNGVKVFSFEEWRNGVRHDRHRFPVKLKAGKNTVLVKISQSAAPNPEPNWEFILRVVDATGKGVATKQ